MGVKTSIEMPISLSLSFPGGDVLASLLSGAMSDFRGILVL